ncbi:MAG: hypothetical protein Kow0042_28120 [Calditrichia bacterium]
MSERFQKTFIPVREFVESWDKELYELNNLDFFIYQLINHLGNQLEKRFFVHDRLKSVLYLDFENLGTLCFNIGDAFELFLKDNCFGTCPLNCPRDLDKKVDLDETIIEEKLKRKLQTLQSFMAGQLDKEQCLRVDLMNSVILDTLIQYYTEVFQLEIAEDDFSLLELGEFIEDVIIEFIRVEGQPYLNQPFETALDYFEELLDSEVDEEEQKEWYEEKQDFIFENSTEDWQKSVESIEDVFNKFLSDPHYNPRESNAALLHDINFFKRYLNEYTLLTNIYDLHPDHIGEFFSIWLAQEFVLSDEKQIPFIFQATARFITFLYHHYNINLKREFLKTYENMKIALPRVIQAMNQFIADYNLLDALLRDEEARNQERNGYFEITNLYERTSRSMDLKDIHWGLEYQFVKLNSSAFSKINRGDILYASLNKNGIRWEIVDIQYIYPAMGKIYILNNK